MRVLSGVSYSLINVYVKYIEYVNIKFNLTLRYVKNKDGIIEVYRNKRKPIRRIKEAWKNEDGCLACVLFDVCSEWTGRTRSTCEAMEDMGVIDPNEKGDRFFVDV